MDPKDTPAARHLGRELVSFDPATGRGRLRFHARPEFQNRHGGVQGGFLAAMLDAATAYPLITSLPEGRTAVTMSLEVTYFAPAPLGQLTAESVILTNDGLDAEVEAELFDPSGKLVAKARSRLRIRAKRG